MRITTNVTGAPHTEDGTYSLKDPISARAMLLDGDESIKGLWGGDLIFDNFFIHLNKVGGLESGLTLRYGVDITDLSLEQDISEVPTHVYPYYKGQRQVTNQSTQQQEDEEYFLWGHVTAVPSYKPDNPEVYHRKTKSHTA